MPTEENYVVQYNVSSAEMKAELESFLPRLDNIIRRSKKGKLTQRLGNLAEEYKRSIKRIIRQTTASSNSYLGREFTRIIKTDITNNFRTRFDRAFPLRAVTKKKRQVKRRLLIVPRTNRYKDAVYSDNFSEVFFKSGKLIGAVGNQQTLDTYTSIYVDAFGNLYEPPQSYGDIHAYWRFQEFTGAGYKLRFKSRGSYWFVLKNFGLKGFARKNFMLQIDGSPVRQDVQALSKLKKTVQGRIQKEIRFVRRHKG